jgi:hypothetical protein
MGAYFDRHKATRHLRTKRDKLAVAIELHALCHSLRLASACLEIKIITSDQINSARALFEALNAEYAAPPTTLVNGGWDVHTSLCNSCTRLVGYGGKLCPHLMQQKCLKRHSMR